MIKNEKELDSEMLVTLKSPAPIPEILSLRGIERELVPENDIPAPPFSKITEPKGEAVPGLGGEIPDIVDAGEPGVAGTMLAVKKVTPPSVIFFPQAVGHCRKGGDTGT